MPSNEQVKGLSSFLFLEDKRKRFSAVLSLGDLISGLVQYGLKLYKIMPYFFKKYVKIRKGGKFGSISLKMEKMATKYTFISFIFF